MRPLISYELCFNYIKSNNTLGVQGSSTNISLCTRVLESSTLILVIIINVTIFCLGILVLSSLTMRGLTYLFIMSSCLSEGKPLDNYLLKYYKHNINVISDSISGHTNMPDAFIYTN
jgi:hypothetical protein